MDSSSPEAAPIGSLLEQAALVTPAQVQVALQDQSYCGSRIGEILALRGWIKQETADFFAEQWPLLLHDPSGIPFGQCLEQAFLVTAEQIERAVNEQHSSGLRIGAIFVLNGWLKQPTVDFFLKGLAPQRITESPFIVKPHTTARPTPIHSIFQTKETGGPIAAPVISVPNDDDDFEWLG